MYVRDDRPFGGKNPPAALFYASRDRTREHPERHLSGYAGILQADAFDGYNRLYLPNRKPRPIIEALCWSHARRKFFELADIAANARRGKSATPISPIALEAVKRIDALFDIEREIIGLSGEIRMAERQKRSVVLVTALEDWMRAERAKLSRHAEVAKAIDYMRAQSVHDYLVAKGVSASRMKTISCGKERPVATCDDISCWSQNCRAVTVLNGVSGNS